MDIDVADSTDFSFVRHLYRLNLIVALVILFSSICQAQESEPSDSREAILERRFKIEINHATKFFDPKPSDFQRKHLQPPSNFGIRLRSIEDRSGTVAMGYWLEVELGFLRSSIIPLMTVAGGIATQTGSVAVDLGAEVVSQHLVSREPYDGSAYDHTRASLMADIRVPMSWLEFKIPIRAVYLPDVTLKKRELLETDLRYKYQYLADPSLTIKTPLGLAAQAAVGIYYLGDVGVASKQFGALIKSDTVYRPNVGIGFFLGKLEVWARYSRLQGVRDPIAIFTQAPFMTRPYMMAKEMATLEVAWNF